MHKLWIEVEDIEPLVEVVVSCFADIEQIKKYQDDVDPLTVAINDPYNDISSCIFAQEILSVTYAMDLSSPYKRDYSKIIKKSSISPYLQITSNKISFKYDFDTPYTSVLFIGSLLRYPEEASTLEDVINEPLVSKRLNDPLLSKVEADLLLAYISSKMDNSGHRVFTPNKVFKENYYLFDKYITECSRVLTYKVTRSGKEKRPSEVLLAAYERLGGTEYFYSGSDITFSTFLEFINYIILGEEVNESPSPW